jgi:hypothetical protein
MGRDRRRAATGRGSRRSRRLHTLERLEPRCVLNGSAPWIAPPGPPPVSQGHADVDSSAFVSGPSSDLVGRLAELDHYPQSGVPGSPPLDGRNVRSLSPTDEYGGENGSVAASNSSVANSMTTWSPTRTTIVGFVIATQRSLWTGFYDAQTGTVIFVEHLGESGPIGVPMKAPSSDYYAPPSPPELAASYPVPPTPENSPHYMHQPALDTAGAAQAVGSLPSTTPASAPSVASAAQSQQPVEAGTAAQVARSTVLDSAAGQMNSAALTVVRATEPLAGSVVGQAIPMPNVDVQSFWNHAPIGPRGVADLGGRSTATLPLVRAFPLGGVVQLPDGKAALANMPLDLRRMEQALETVVSEVKLIGPEVARWLDGIHVTPLTVAIAAAAVASGSVYYLRRRGTRRADGPEDEASSSWLFARLQPTPE